MILGAEVYDEIVLSNIKKGPQGTPTAQLTELGWILFGKAFKNNFSSISSIDVLQVDELFRQFFEIEEMPDKRTFTPDEHFVIDFFEKNISKR